MYLAGLKRGRCERRSSIKRAGGGVPGGGRGGKATGERGRGAVNFLSLKSCNMRSVGHCLVLRFARHCPGLHCSLYTLQAIVLFYVLLDIVLVYVLLDIVLVYVLLEIVLVYTVPSTLCRSLSCFTFC